MTDSTPKALLTAIQIAIDAHADHFDKTGKPYIFHPLEVMLLGKTDEERIVGILHDVVEDSTDWPLDRLKPHFAPEIIEAVDAMSRRPGEEYEKFVRRAISNPIAREVKRHDLASNMKPERLADLDDRTRDRLMTKYQSALQILAEQAA